ncbi:hypothetical protein GCM10023319_28660 [Nocardia iowensis]
MAGAAGVLPPDKLDKVLAMVVAEPVPVAGGASVAVAAGSRGRAGSAVAWAVAVNGASVIALASTVFVTIRFMDFVPPLVTLGYRCCHGGSWVGR